MELNLMMALSVLFCVFHLGLSHGPLREALVKAMGEMPFKGLHSLASFVTLGGAIWLYRTHRGEGALLWTTPALALPAVYALVGLGFFLLFTSFATPSPSGMMPVAIANRGVLRITRHPMNMGIALFALAHLLANGYLGDAVFWGSIFAAGFFGAYHQDRRKAREKGEAYVKFQQETSVFPFAALVQGKTKLEFWEFKLPLVIAALAAFLAFLYFHGRLFGPALF